MISVLLLFTLLSFLLLSSSYILTVCSQLTEEKWSFYHSSRAHVHRPSCVATEVERLNALTQKKIGQSVLGKVKKHNIRKLITIVLFAHHFLRAFYIFVCTGMVTIPIPVVKKKKS